MVVSRTVDEEFCVLKVSFVWAKVDMFLFGVVAVKDLTMEHS